MPAVNTYRCLLISPSDVAAEREAMLEVSAAWNAQIGPVLGARIELVRWESHSTPDLHAPPQEVLNSQLVIDCDFAIAIFWSRIGTPTSEYRSGSEEEIHALLEAGRKVLVYFNRSAIPQAALETDQYSRLKELRTELEARGLVGYYDTIAQLRERVQLNVTGVVASLRDSQSTAPQDPLLTAARPDIRVHSSVGAIALHGGTVEPMLSISVENHSPIPVFIVNVLIELEDGRNLFPRADSYTGQLNSRRKLEPGDSFEFNMRPSDFGTSAAPELMKRAAARDAIGRVYRSDEAAFRNHVRLAFSSKGREPDA